MAKRIAVIGLSFRFPRTNTADYWRDLLQGKDLVSQVDESRWSSDAYFHPQRDHPGTAYTRSAGSLGDISGFDADFFGISPREAALMDPQQRLLLELCWEGFENAGLRPSRIRGSDCGVYIGIASADYAYRLADDLEVVDASIATGNTSSIAANRLSYVFDLRGPSMAVDTACSSSLVAFHQACRAISAGDATMAVAGGVSLHLHPYGFVTFSKASMLSPRGRCRVFDASADGYVRAEGGGLFILKDYDAALADGDPILAVVAGTAVNTDGRKSGLTVPSADAQTRLLTQAYAQAGIDPRQIDYLEAHGTGTPVGDPIETHAIGMALGRQRAGHAPLPIGSVKSNQGHLEAASGVAGLVKALYCLRHREVPATIGVDEINPNIDCAAWNIDIVRQRRALPERGTLTVGVNSFGFGGANAHVILQTPPDEPHAPLATLATTSAIPLVISGKQPAALKAAARDMARHLRSQPSRALYDIAYQAALRRDWHAERAVVYGATSEAIAQALAAFAEESGPRRLVTSGRAVPDAQGPVFVYSGNGSQWAGMGERLMHNPVFAEAVHEIDAYFHPLAGYLLGDALRAAPGDCRYDSTEYAQPALFAMQVGMTRMLNQRGIVARAVAGHSVGEVAAAWASGALTLADAVQVIFHRSRLQGLTRGRGAMTAVGVDGGAALAMIAELGLSRVLSVAGHNSSRGATIAGNPDALAVLENALRERRAFQRRLDLDYAFHSPAMDGISGALHEALAGLTPGKTAIPFYSTVAGACIDGATLDANYWWRNVRQPVRFDEAMAALIEQGENVFVEIGPHPVVRGYINDALKQANVEGRVIVTATRGEDDPQRVHDAAGQVVASGAAPQWQTLFPWPGRHVELPAYAWQRERHWHPLTPSGIGLLERRRAHPLLGYPLRQHESTWENQLDCSTHPTLADHVVDQAVVFPGTGFAEMALAAAQARHADGEYVELEDLEIHAPLLLAAGATKVTRCAVDPKDGRWQVSARDQGSDGAWTTHATARILSEPGAALLGERAPALPERPADFDAASHLALTESVGLDYGPAFRAVERGWLQDDGDIVAQLRMPEAIAAELATHHLHPAVFDSVLQLIIHWFGDDARRDSGLTYVPARIGRLAWRRGAGPVHSARVRLLRRNPHSLMAEFALFDASGRQVAHAREARFRSIRLRKGAGEALDFLNYVGVPRPHPHADAPPPLRVADGERAILQAIDADALKRYAYEVDPLLDSLCRQFTFEALHALADSDGLLPASTVTRCREAVDGGAPLLEQLLRQAQEDGQLDATPSGWRLRAADPQEPRATDIWNTLVREYPEHFRLAQAVGRVGLSLPALLRGERTLDDVHPPALTPGSLTAQLLPAGQQRRLGRHIASWLATAVAQLRGDARLRVLECGADGPAFGLDCYQALDDDRIDFVYRSSRGAAIDEAERLRERCPDLVVQTIDDSEPPEGRFDLAILHANWPTLDEARQALGHVRHCLAPGGVLLLLANQPTAWLDFIFGARGQWWSASVAGDATPALQPAAFWRRELQALGCACEPAADFLADTRSGPYLLAATVATVADGHTVDTADAPPARRWLLLADTADAAVARPLAARLRAAGQEVVAVGDAPEDDADLVRWLREAVEGAPVDGVIHAAGLAATAHIDAAAMLRHQVRRCALAAATLQAGPPIADAPLWLLTRGAAQHLAGDDAVAPAADSALWGYGRTLMNESGDTRMLDLPRNMADFPLDALTRELLWPDAEQELALAADGSRYAPRLRLAPRPAPRADCPAEAPRDAAAVQLGFELPGQLRALAWRQAPLPAPADGQLEVAVAATGLNFRDVMYALGMLSDEAIENGFAGATLGLEFAGTVTRAGADVQGFAAGDRVVGFGPASFADRVLTAPAAVARVPAGMSLEAAATIPSTFFTTYYALHHLAQLEPGEKVLIHGAAGGVGIAAIQYAQWRGAEIHASAGTADKRDFLRLLGVQHIYDSRTLSYADEVLANTGGAGVDVVLNSLAGEAIHRNLVVLKPFGRFLELGKRDFYENTRIGLRPFRNNISYFGIDADQLMARRPALTQRLFADMMALFEAGALHPLPHTVFHADQVVDAFRHMQQARQIGKIVVTGMDEVRRAPAATPRPNAALALDPRASYLVTGGLGGFGLRTAQWLAEKGARHLVLASRRGAVEPDTQAALAALRQQGVAVQAVACDVTDRAALATLLAGIPGETPLRGIVHAAMVIDDALARNTDAARIERVLAPKLLGAQHLDALTAGLPLDFFVCFSSATTLFGNPGQSNYVAANAWLEAFCRARRERGLPATSVAWGALDDVGYLARNAKVRDALAGRMGGQALRSEVALQALEDILLADRSDLGVLELDWNALARFLPSAASPKFGDVARRRAQAGGPDLNDDDIRHLAATLDDAALQARLVEILKAEVGEILRVPMDRLDASRSVYDMGLDSLMGVELVVALENRCGLKLPVMALSESPTIEQLAERLVSLLRGESDPTADATAAQVRQVAAQHAADVPADSLAEFAADLDTAAPRQKMIH